MFLLGRSYY